MLQVKVTYLSLTIVVKTCAVDLIWFCGYYVPLA